MRRSQRAVEFQIFAKGSKKAADDTWMARYLMLRLCEKYEVDLVLYCKPSRATGTDRACTPTSPPGTCAKSAARNILKPHEGIRRQYCRAHRSVRPGQSPAPHRPSRTQAIDKFSYGLSDRGASVRLPVNFIKNGYKGYLEDRRPNSEGDPYQIISRILKTINSVPVAELVPDPSSHRKIPAASQSGRDFCLVFHRRCRPRGMKLCPIWVPGTLGSGQDVLFLSDGWDRGLSFFV